MKSLAIIGTGIAGMYCGYALHTRYRLTVYEKNDYAGGHTHTVDVPEGDRPLSMDTGFMVFNEVTYPNLVRLFQELHVKVKAAPMSFSVQHRPTGLEFCGSGWNGLFAQRRNLFRWTYWLLLSEIGRFNRTALEVLGDPRFAGMTLAQYARQRGYSADFLNFYLVPMSSAVWSTPPDVMLEFPVATLVQFFKNHGFLGLYTQHPWLTVEGGSRVYRDKIIAPYRDRIRLSCRALRVARRDGRVWVTDTSGKTDSFDVVIMASHADETLQMLENPTPREAKLLSPFAYQLNRATVHTDDRVMPRTPGCWSSWNYAQTTSGAYTVYWMNRLQGVSKNKNYFVSINDPDLVRPEHVLRQIDYTHPIFSPRAIAAQIDLPLLNEEGPVYFCGSYFRYGFHEDALTSAVDVVAKLV